MPQDQAGGIESPKDDVEEKETGARIRVDIGQDGMRRLFIGQQNSRGYRPRWCERSAKKYSDWGWREKSWARSSEEDGLQIRSYTAV